MTGRTTSSMRIRLTEKRRDDILRELVEMYTEEFDETLSSFRAEQVLSFFIQTLGPSVYNQAIQDARMFMAEKLEDLDVTFYEAEAPGHPVRGAC